MKLLQLELKFGVLLVGMAVLVFSGCMKSEYQQLVDSELAKGVRQDSLFLGLYLGMTEKDFFDRCWQLNEEQVLTHGNGNISAKYEITELPYVANLNFYPTYFEGKIIEMPTTLQYKAWSPWDKTKSADSLQMAALKLFDKWYGGDFLKIEHPEKQPAYVKVTGNRRLVVSKINDQMVQAVFTDLIAEGKKKKEDPLADSE